MFVSDTKKLNLVGVCIACVALPLDTDGSGPETITQQRRPWLTDYNPSECRASSLSKRTLYSEAPILLGSGNAPHREGEINPVPHQRAFGSSSRHLYSPFPFSLPNVDTFHSWWSTSPITYIKYRSRAPRPPRPYDPIDFFQTRPGRGWPVRPQRPRHLATACVLPELDHLPPHTLLDSLGSWPANDSPV